MNDKELPLDRLATTDKEGKRIYLYPSEVRGSYRTWRTRLTAVLILFFLILPWIRIGGHQALLLDISQRRFAILGLTFWAHDAPMLLFVFGGAAMLLGLVTAIWGRVWCGWACPQTVFVDGVFRRIERWIEGDSLARSKLDASPLSGEKIVKKTAKWISFSLIGLIISHSFLAYFVGTEALAAMIRQSPSEHPGAFAIMAGFTAIILFDFGWFREQFCTLVCPYGRFQSVLMDDQSSVVAYDQKRGEPRRGIAAPAAPQGDCVNCYRCVQVCPTGIDIRRGVQLECIACTACMDACDDVMSRMKKPRGLIRYGTQATTEGQSEKSLPWFARARVWIHLATVILFGSGLASTVATRTPIEMTFIRAVDIPYQEVTGPNGRAEVINHYKVALRNQTFQASKLTLQLTPEAEQKGISLVVANHQAILAAGASGRSDIFIRFPKDTLTSGHSSISVGLKAEAIDSPLAQTYTHEVRLVGPIF